MGRVLDQYVRVLIAVIGASVVTTAIINYRGTVEIGKLFVELPINLVNSLTRR